jgi:hypothetical protein
MKALCKFYELLIQWGEVIYEHRKADKSKYY